MRCRAFRILLTIKRALFYIHCRRDVTGSVRDEERCKYRMAVFP